MEKVYLVTCGTYSDYHVCAAFTTRDRAEEFIEKGFASRLDAEVEEYTLNPGPHDYPELEKGWRIWKVEMRGDYCSASRFDLAKSYQHLERYGRENLFLAPPFSSRRNWTIQVFADSRERAVKRASELRAQEIAAKSS